MPTSYRDGKLISRLLIEDADPYSVWDVGPGDGTYSDLARSYTTCSWVGIEVWEPYILEYDLNRKYNQIINLDIRDVDFSFSNIPTNSLIIFGDVLEHMPEDDARQLILRAKENFRWILVSLPIIHIEQGAINGNPYEEHVKHWTFDEMHAVMGNCTAIKGPSLGVYWWDREENI